MLRIGIQMFRIPAFKCFKSRSNDWNCQSNASNPVQIVEIGIWMLRIPFEWLEFAFECSECCSNCSNCHLNASNPVPMVGISIRMLRIPFEWFEFAFKWFESRSNGSNLHSNGSNPVWMLGICIWMLWNSFKKVEFALSALNPIRMVGIGIRMLRILFGNFHSNGSNLVRLGKIFLESACYTIFTVLRNFLGLVHAFVTV